MLKRNFPAALADLKQDIAGDIPLNLVRAWAECDGDEATHTALLAPYVMRGIAAASDSAGLSRLSGSRPLLEVLKLVHEPKEIIHAHGLALGGKAIGIWVADNTETFFPASVPAAEVVAQMAAAQREIAASCEVQVGIALHRGEFVSLGGGLFGEDADFVELVAEEHTCGGELVVGSGLAAELTSDPQFLLEERTDLVPYGLRVHRVGVSAACRHLSKVAGGRYPAAFTPDFYDLLCTVPADTALADTVLANAGRVAHYGRECAVVLVKVRHETSPLLLDRLAGWVLANVEVVRVARRQEIEPIKSNGSLAIFVTQDHTAAIEVAHRMRSALAGAGYGSAVGVAAGASYVFPMEGGGHDIAGNPVNLASKLAEDSGGDGVLVHESVRLPAGEPAAAFSFRISGVEIRGVRLLR